MSSQPHLLSCFLSQALRETEGRGELDGCGFLLDCLFATSFV